MIIEFGDGDMYIGASKRAEDKCLTAIVVGRVARAQTVGDNIQPDNLEVPILVLHFFNADSARVLQKWANRIVDELSAQELKETAEEIKEAVQETPQSTNEPNA